MNGVNIGTLAGRIEFEDKISTTMEAVLQKVDKLEARFGGLNTSVKSVAGGFILAEAAIKGVEKVLSLGIELVKDFTTEGAGIADVEENFHRLAEGAGRVGETMLGVLRDGTHGTINDFELMKTVNDQFAAGIELTNEQMMTLAEGGFALAQAKGIDVATAFDTLNKAMLTGQVRQVQMLTGKIDLTKAEDDYAKALGTTSERLTPLEKQEAAREAILRKVGDATARLGEQTDGVDEIIAQVTTSWHNFYNELTSSIAASPKVVQAFVTVKDAIFNALGGSSEAILDNFMSMVDDTADIVTEFAPKVIDWFVRVKDNVVAFYGGAVEAWERFGPMITTGFGLIKDFVVGIYDAVIATWDALPDWLKRVAERSAITAAGLYVIASGAEAAGGGFMTLGNDIGTMVSGFRDLPDLFKAVAGGLVGMTASAKMMWAVMDFSSIANIGASFSLLGGSIASTIGPLGIAAVYAAALFAAYELGKWEPISDFFMELGLELQGFSQAEQDAMIAADKAGQAAQKQAKETKQQTDILKLLNDVQEQVEASTNAVTDAFGEQGGVMGDTTERTKEFALAWESLNRLGTTYADTLSGVSGNLRASVMEYAELGASVEDLFQAFPKLTKAQAEAAVASVKGAESIRKAHDETFEIIAKGHGDNINDWIEGEKRKLAATLESLKLQGQLTDEMLNAQMAKFDATIDVEIAKRAEANTLSRNFYQKQVDDAQAALDLMLVNSTNHTDAEIRLAYRTVEEKKRALNGWSSAVNDAMTEQTNVVQAGADQQVQSIMSIGDAWQRGVVAVTENGIELFRTLSGELVTLEEKMARLAGGSFTHDIQPLTRGEMLQVQSDMHMPTGGDPTRALMAKLDALLDMEGKYAPKSKDEYLKMINDQVLLAKLKMWAQDNNIPIPSFRNGGYGDFKEGTLAMLHGKEMIVPMNGGASGGGPGNSYVFHVNGTAEETAQKIFAILMRNVKVGRPLGAA